MYSSTRPDTPHPVVRLGKSEHVEPASRSKSKASRLRGEARDYVMMAHWITAVVTGLLVLSPGSDCSESESSLAIRIKCTQVANPGRGQRTDPRIPAEVPRREARRLKPAE